MLGLAAVSSGGQSAMIFSRKPSSSLPKVEGLSSVSEVESWRGTELARLP